MQLKITITMDEFGWSELEEQARMERVGLEELVSQACAHYESERDDDRPATVVPRFARSGDRQRRTLTIERSSRSFGRLRREAERQGVTMERLVEHATLLYLADFEAGRVAERIARRADE